MKFLWVAIGVLLAFGTVASSAREAALPVTTLVLDTDKGPHVIRAEVAADQPSQERGLMFRRQLGPDEGMLFDFHKPQWEVFWMKNTILSLDMIFIRADGTISSVAPQAVPYSETAIPSAEPVRAVLEINGGRAAVLGIGPGQRVHNAIFGNALAGQR